MLGAGAGGMRLLIVGLNYAPEKVGIAVYTAGMAEALAAEGHEVRVIAGQPYYPAWRIAEGYNAWALTLGEERGVQVTRVPHYIPAHPSGGKRLLHHASFAAMALLPAIWNAIVWRPDVVLAVAPSLIGAPIARLAAWLAGAHSWLHVHDFEVEAAFATGLLEGGGRHAALARWFEGTVLKSFERVSSISPEMCRRLVEKGVPAERVSELRNWAELDAVRPMTRPSSYRQEWNIETEHVALYSGNIAALCIKRTKGPTTHRGGCDVRGSRRVARVSASGPNGSQRSPGRRTATSVCRPRRRIAVGISPTDVYGRRQ